MLPDDTLALHRKDLAGLLVAHRNRSDLTQHQLATRIGYSRSTVATAETGDRQPADDFWSRCDQVLHADGALRDAYGRFVQVRQEDRRRRLLAERRARDARRGLDQRPTVAAAVPDEKPPEVAAVESTTVFGAVDRGGAEDVQRRSFVGLTAAAVLDTALASRAGRTDTGRPEQVLPAPHPWASDLQDAVLHPSDLARQATRTGDLPSVETLVIMAASCINASFAADHSGLATRLPRLIGMAEAASLASGAGQVDAMRVLSDVYSVGAWTLIKADLAVAAYIAAERATRVAEQIGDMARASAATRCMSEVRMRAGRYDDAVRTAFVASTMVDTPRPTLTATCIRGAALLSAAAAAARSGDRHAATVALRAAEAWGDRLGQDRSDLGTMFGPTNVAIHRVAIAIELGDAAEADRHIPAVDVAHMPAELGERRARFLIDVARVKASLGDHAAALGALIDAERAGPDEVRTHRLAREVVLQLASSERRSGPLRALADRCGVPL